MAALALSAIIVAVSAVPAAAVAGGVFMGGDSLAWQACQGALQRFPAMAPQILRDLDDGCHGWSGATTAEFDYEIQGGRFLSDGDGQPHPRFHDRGHRDPWNVREAMDRAAVLIIGLGTNETNRERYLGRDSPWPIRLGPGHVPGHVSPEQMAANIDYIVWLANGRAVFWYDVAVPARPEHDQSCPGDQRRDLECTVPSRKLPRAPLVDQSARGASAAAPERRTHDQPRA